MKMIYFLILIVISSSIWMIVETGGAYASMYQDKALVWGMLTAALADVFLNSLSGYPLKGQAFSFVRWIIVSSLLVGSILVSTLSISEPLLNKMLMVDNRDKILSLIEKELVDKQSDIVNFNNQRQKTNFAIAINTKDKLRIQQRQVVSENTESSLHLKLTLFTAFFIRVIFQLSSVFSATLAGKLYLKEKAKRKRVRKPKGKNTYGGIHQAWPKFKNKF